MLAVQEGKSRRTVFLGYFLLLVLEIKEQPDTGGHEQACSSRREYLRVMNVSVAVDCGRGLLRPQPCLFRPGRTWPAGTDST